jgi:pyruvate dehydrogenase E2 component (dihydrolipoamide acetyltransferase)
VLAKILIEAKHSSELAVGSPIAITVEDSAAYQAFLKLDPAAQLAGVPSLATVSKPPPAPTPAVADVAPKTVEVKAPAVPSKVEVVAATAVQHHSGEVKMSPAARHLIETLQIDPSLIKIISDGSFAHGKGLIRKEDVIRSVREGLTAPKSSPVVAAPVAVAPSSGFVDIPNNNIRKVIAKRLTESKLTVPHTYTTQECNIDALMDFRKALKKDFDVNVSVNDIIVKAAALALRDVPEANSRFDKASGAVKKPIVNAAGGPQIDISVAVATPTGLITPIVFGADRRGLSDISSTVINFLMLSISFVTSQTYRLRILLQEQKKEN